MEFNHTRPTKYPGLGNGLAAGKDFQRGDLILRIKEPFLIVAEKDALDQVCSFCLIDFDESYLKLCSKCKVVRYCSQTCQKADWKLIHKSECAVLVTLPYVPPTPLRALFQYLIRWGKSSSTLDPKSAGLENHVSNQRKDEKRWSEMTLQSTAAIDFSKSPRSKLEMVTTLMCVMATNAFRATLPDDTPSGLCYEPAVALANHSCTPNAFIMFDGRTVSLLALNSAKEGDQIFISYVDFTQPRSLRRAELQKRFFFLCNCEKCTQDDNVFQTFIKTAVPPASKIDLFVDRKSLESHATSRIASVKRLEADSTVLQDAASKSYTLLERCEEEESPSKLLKLLKQALSEMKQFRTHELFALPPYPNVLDEIHLTYVDEDHLPSALIILLFIYLNCDVYIRPQLNHPARVTRLFVIVRLLKYVASLDVDVLAKDLKYVPKEILKSIDFIDAVHVVLVIIEEWAPKSHGKDTNFMRQVMMELEEVEEVQRLRGSSGSAIRSWQSGGGKEGAAIAERIFDGLRILAGYAFEVIEKQRV